MDVYAYVTGSPFGGQWLPLPAFPIVTPAKELYRFWVANMRPHARANEAVYICTREKTRNGFRPADILDTITPRSWGQGERTGKELRAMLAGEVETPENTDYWREGEARPDWFYYAVAAGGTDTHTFVITVHRDRDENPDAQ